MPDLSGEPALTGADGLVLLAGTDRPKLNCAYEPVLASTDEPVFTDTDGLVLAGTENRHSLARMDLCPLPIQDL